MTQNDPKLIGVLGSPRKRGGKLAPRPRRYNHKAGKDRIPRKLPKKMIGDLCAGYNCLILDDSDSDIELGDVWDGDHRPKNVKRLRLRCPRCGRRVKSSVWCDDDGDVYHNIPPHKPKGWWK